MGKASFQSRRLALPRAEEDGGVALRTWNYDPVKDHVLFEPVNSMRLSVNNGKDIVARTTVECEASEERRPARARFPLLPAGNGRRNYCRKWWRWWKR